MKTQRRKSTPQAWKFRERPVGRHRRQVRWAVWGNVCWVTWEDARL